MQQRAGQMERRVNDERQWQGVERRLFPARDLPSANQFGASSVEALLPEQNAAALPVHPSLLTWIEICMYAAVWIVTVWTSKGAAIEKAAVAVALTSLTVLASSLAGAHRRFDGPMRIVGLRRNIKAGSVTTVVVLGLDAVFEHPVGIWPCLIGSAVNGAVAISMWVINDHRTPVAGGSTVPTARILVVADEGAGIFDLLGEDNGFHVVACVGRCQESARAHRLPWKGSGNDLMSVIDAVAASSVFFGPGHLCDEKVHELIPQLRRRGIDVQFHAGLRGVHHRQLRTVAIAHEPFLYLEEPRLEWCQHILKRMVDIVLGSVMLVVAAPVMMAAAVAIKLEDRGVIVFKQRRVGLNGRPFDIYKLRTMQPDAETRLQELHHLNERHGGPLFKVTNDPRVTRIGRVLRATSIDELPQLWCVVRGSMSLVGPRPALPTEAVLFDHRLAERQRVRPGVTGLWQVEQRESGSFDHYRNLDIFYVENWSLLLDLAILLRTIPAVLRRGPRTGARSLQRKPLTTDPPGEQSLAVRAAESWLRPQD